MDREELVIELLKLWSDIYELAIDEQQLDKLHEMQVLLWDNK